MQQGGVDGGTAGIVNAGGTAGNDHAFTAAQLGGANFTGGDLGVDAQIADAAGDQVAILPARVKHGDLRSQMNFTGLLDLVSSAAAPASSWHYPKGTWLWAATRSPFQLQDPA